jgi:hypothetical protein
MRSKDGRSLRAGASGCRRIGWPHLVSASRPCRLRDGGLRRSRWGNLGNQGACRRFHGHPGKGGSVGSCSARGVTLFTHGGGRRRRNDHLGLHHTRRCLDGRSGDGMGGRLRLNPGPWWYLHMTGFFRSATPRSRYWPRFRRRRVVRRRFRSRTDQIDWNDGLHPRVLRPNEGQPLPHEEPVHRTPKEPQPLAKTRLATAPNS